jgi:hypothetical protein
MESDAYLRKHKGLTEDRTRHRQPGKGYEKGGYAEELIEL